MTRFLHYAVFALGLAVACWIGAAYVTTNPLALVVTILIAAVYLVGALELYRYQQATWTLTGALTRLSEPPSSLAQWLEQLHPSLRNAVRMRVEGERVGLPGPTLTPYLVGLLVLLGMLGTFLGMVATLRGTGLALESSTDLEAMRASLAAPVKGLGFAFGTSVAGVATSAMLGLLSALCRRERIEAAQMLDAKIATTLRIYSSTHQREEGFKLLQRQAEVMPTVVDRLQAMMATIEQQNQALNDRLVASQDVFHSKAETTYTHLASSVGQTLKESLVDGVRAASAAIQPAVDATMAGLARETAVLHGTITQAVQQQLDGLSTRFETTTATVADLWKDALAGQRLTNESLTKDLRISLDGFTDTFEQRSTSLLDGVSTRLEGITGNLSEAWGEAMSRHERASEKLAADNQQALTSSAATFAEQSASLVRTVGQAHGDLQTQLASQDEQRLAAWTASLGSITGTLRQEWEQLGTVAASRQREICDALAQTARDISSETRVHASTTLAEIDRLVQVAADAPKATVALQAELASQDQHRLSAWTASLGAMAATLRQEWEQTGAHTANRQQEICNALAQTAREISADTRTHASTMLTEIDRLVQVAAQAPQAAAALQAELASQDQQRLSAWTESLASMATTLRQEWEQTGAHTASQQQEICDALAQTARDISADTRTHASTTLTEIDRLVQVAAQAPQAAAALQAELASQDQQRLSAWTESLATMAATLRQEWEQAGATTARSQQQICEALAQTARDISSEAQAHASSTIAEIALLVQAASEAPKAAADVVTEIRQKLSDSMARDNVMLEERSRLLETLGTLLDAVNHASTEQRAAVDALVATSADVLDRVGTQFTNKVEAETGKLTDIAAQVTGSAIEVASLGEAFGAAVQLFSQSNESLVGHLQRIEAALDKSTTRSDEQLAYYVAQAREVIDLSIMSQKQIIEDLQQLAGQQISVGTQAT